MGAPGARIPIRRAPALQRGRRSTVRRVSRSTTALIAGLVLVAYQAVSLWVRWRGTASLPPAERKLGRVAALVVRGSGLLLGVALMIWSQTV